MVLENTTVSRSSQTPSVEEWVRNATLGDIYFAAGIGAYELLYEVAKNRNAARELRVLAATLVQQAAKVLVEAHEPDIFLLEGIANDRRVMRETREYARKRLNDEFAQFKDPEMRRKLREFYGKLEERAARLLAGDRSVPQVRNPFRRTMGRS